MNLPLFNSDLINTVSELVTRSRGTSEKSNSAGSTVGPPFYHFSFSLLLPLKYKLLIP